MGGEGAGVWLLELASSSSGSAAAEANPALVFLGSDSSELLQNGMLRRLLRHRNAKQHWRALCLPVLSLLVLGKT